jgi:hypothetical protein
MNYQNNKIYESPDGGKTIYEREIGSTERIMIREDPERKYIEQYNNWRDILKVARNNTTLHDLVEQAEMVYAIIKEENN